MRGGESVCGRVGMGVGGFSKPVKVAVTGYRAEGRRRWRFPSSAAPSPGPAPRKNGACRENDQPERLHILSIVNRNRRPSSLTDPPGVVLI